MKPQIHIGQMNELPARRQARICKCSERCKEYVILIGNDDFVLCKNEAKDHAYDILRELGLLVLKSTSSASKPVWTTKELKKVKDYVLTHGTHDGYHTLLAMELGKTKAAVKKQIARLRKSGELPLYKRG